MDPKQVNTIDMVHNSHYQYPCLSLPVRYMIDKTIGRVLSRVHGDRPRVTRGEGGNTPTLSENVNTPSETDTIFSKTGKVIPYIDYRKDITCADIPGTPIAPLLGVKGKTGIFSRS